MKRFLGLVFVLCVSTAPVWAADVKCGAGSDCVVAGKPGVSVAVVGEEAEGAVKTLSAPIPSAVWLFGSALGLVGVARWRKEEREVFRL